MYWSAALSLKSNKPPRWGSSGYGSFGSTTSSVSRSSSRENIRIPESIPEHQPLSHFASPRLHHEEFKLAESFDEEDPLSGYSHATVTITASPITTIQMLLMNNQLDTKLPTKGGYTYSHTEDNQQTFFVARAAGEDSHPSPPSHSSRSSYYHHYKNQEQEDETLLREQLQNNYWMQERERLRTKRGTSARRLSPTARTPLVGDEQSMSSLKMGLIMCSVPLTLVLVFVIYIICVNGEDGASLFSLSSLIGSNSRSLRGSA